MSNDPKLEALTKRKQKARLGGGLTRLEKQRSSGKLTARERLELLFDQGLFTELDTLVTHRCHDFDMDSKHYECEAVVTGFGKLNGRTVCAYSQDFTVFGGSLSLHTGQKIAKLMDHAMRNGHPVIGINDSGGARIQEGVDSLAGYGSIFVRNVALSGVVPQITVVVGPAAGGAVYSPAITDFILMVKQVGRMYITGPAVVKAATGEEIDHETLGGAAMHSAVSGVAHFASDSEQECFTELRRLLAFLPSNNLEQPPRKECDDPADRRAPELRSIVPADPAQPYDVEQVIRLVVDSAEFTAVQRDFAPNISVGFARLNGRPIGVVANQPNVLAGMLDVDASVKAARFVRFCDAFNIPLLTFVDVPGFMPGSDQEQAGIIRHGAKLIYAYAEACVPKLTVVLRKAYGGAYIVMNSKELGSDYNIAWPGAEIAVMGPEGAVGIVSRGKLREASDAEALKKTLSTEYREKFANPYFAANRGYIDDVIDPADTRPLLISTLEMLANKVDIARPKRKHGNMPL